MKFKTQLDPRTSHLCGGRPINQSKICTRCMGSDVIHYSMYNCAFEYVEHTMPCECTESEQQS